MAALSGKTAIVTGGSRGSGLGIADELKRSGAVVWITGRNEMALQSAAEKLSIHYVRADVASTDDWDTLMGKVMDECGSIDILVNNAGAGVKIASLDEQKDEEIEQSIGINLTGAIAGCKRVVPIMKKQSFVNTVCVSPLSYHHGEQPTFSLRPICRASTQK